MSVVRNAFLAATAGDVWLPVAEVARRLGESEEAVLELAARTLDAKGWPVVAAIEELDPEAGRWRFMLCFRAGGYPEVHVDSTGQSTTVICKLPNGDQVVCTFNPEPTCELGVWQSSPLTAQIPVGSLAPVAGLDPSGGSAEPTPEPTAPDAEAPPAAPHHHHKHGKHGKHKHRT